MFGSVRRGWRVDVRIGFGLYQSCRNRGMLGVCMCFGCGGVGGVGGKWVGGLDQCLEGWCDVQVWNLCVDGRSRYLCIVLGGYLRI